MKSVEFTIKDNLIKLGVFGKRAWEDTLAVKALLDENIDKTKICQFDAIRYIDILPTGEIAFFVDENDLKGWGKNGFPPTSIVLNVCRRATDCFIKNKKKAVEVLNGYHLPTSVNRILCTHWFMLYKDKDEAVRRFGESTFGKIDCPYDPFLTARLEALYEDDRISDEYKALLI